MPGGSQPVCSEVQLRRLLPAPLEAFVFISFLLVPLFAHNSRPAPVGSQQKEGAKEFQRPGHGGHGDSERAC